MEPERLYTLADVIELVGSTNAKVRYWCEHSDETFVKPRYVAGRNNNKGHYMMFLWTEDQLDEVVASFHIYERRKEARLRIAKENATADPTRLNYYKEYRRKQKEAVDNQTKKELAELAEKLAGRVRPKPEPEPKPKPQPLKKPEFTPLSPEAQDDLEREERAFQFLLEKGLV